MLIELCNDIANDACNGKKKALEVLFYISMAYRMGKHLVFLPHSVVETIRKSQLPDNLRRLYTSIGKQTSSLGILSRKISVKIVVTQKDYVGSENQKILVFNPYCNMQYELYEETHLLTENLQDSDFYLALVTYYKRKYRLNSFAVCFFPLQGGGDTIRKFLENEIFLAQHACLAIVDSDKKYENAKKGDTYKKLKEVLERNKYEFCDLYCMDKVREIENLIPYRMLRDISQYKSNRLIKENFDFDMSYFDMKDGILAKQLSDTKFVSYWRNNLQVNHKSIASIIKYEVLAKTKRKKTKKSVKEVILPGFGSKVLEVFLKNCRNNLMRTTDEDLTEAQRNEWENIGKTIFEWCCSNNIRN